MILQPIEDDIWLAEGDVVSFYGFAYPTRGVIIRLRDGTLWVWSPIALTDDIRAAVDTLGPVGHLVSPNKIHHLYLQDWKAAYPRALLWGPRTTIDKRADLAFETALGDTPPPVWDGQIDQCRFRGSRFMDEMVFFHRASSTLVLADLSENFGDAFLNAHWSWWQRPFARLWKITVGHGYAPLEWRLSFTDRKSARRALDRMLAWNPRRVIMAHGEWQRDNGRAYLEQAFAWLR